MTMSFARGESGTPFSVRLLAVAGLAVVPLAGVAGDAAVADCARLGRGLGLTSTRVGGGFGTGGGDGVARGGRIAVVELCCRSMIPSPTQLSSRSESGGR